MNPHTEQKRSLQFQQEHQKRRGAAEALTAFRGSAKPNIPRPDKAKLETFVNAYPERDYEILFDCPEFTSLCPVTGQPDFGHIRVRYIADRLCIESKSLKLYLYSFRNHHTFHEEAVNRILTDLVKACKPRWMEVNGEFRPRGGISLTITATEGKKP